MPADRPTSFVPVDDLLPKISIEDVCRFYGVPLPELRRIGDEIRTACFLNCGKPQETGDRALAIQAEDPTTRWYCHQYGCGKKGNLVGICDLLKEGENTGGRPRGDRFKQIAADLRAMAGGLLTSPEASPPLAAPAPSRKPARNVPLAESPNERARALVNPRRQVRAGRREDAAARLGLLPEASVVHRGAAAEVAGGIPAPRHRGRQGRRDDARPRRLSAPLGERGSSDLVRPRSGLRGEAPPLGGERAGRPGAGEVPLREGIPSGSGTLPGWTNQDMPTSCGVMASWSSRVRTT